MYFALAGLDSYAWRLMGLDGSRATYERYHGLGLFVYNGRPAERERTRKLFLYKCILYIQLPST